MIRIFSIILLISIMSKVVFSLKKISRIPSTTTKSFQRSFSCNSGPNKRALLEGDDRTDKLKSLDGWKVLKDRDAIQKTYLFKDFIQVCRIYCLRNYHSITNKQLNPFIFLTFFRHLDGCLRLL